MKFRVLLADDHSMFRQALRMSLENAPEIEVIAEVEDGQAVLDSSQLDCPDVVCMDISMPKLNGVQATRQLLAAHTQVKVIGLSAYADPYLIAQMIDAGALGFVYKPNAGDELRTAIEMVSQNQLYLSPALGIADAGALALYLKPDD